MKNAQLKHRKRLCLLYFNITSIRNKLNSSFEFTYSLVDFLAVNETKLDGPFPTGQCNLPVFRRPYRKDLSGKSGGILVYVSINILSKILKSPNYPSNIQVTPVEINLKKQKWLVAATYTPPSQCKNYFITEWTKILGKYTYENTVILEGFYMQQTSQILGIFLEDNSFVTLIKSNTCFKLKPESCMLI